MTFWKAITLLCILTPGCALGLGCVLWCCPPQGPTWALGYRSRRARASDRSWQFAQELAGKIWTLLGLVLLVVSLLLCKGQKDATMEALVKRAVILILVQNVCILLSLIPVEVQLWRLFDRFGRRRGEPEPEPEPVQTFEPTGPIPQVSVDLAQPEEYPEPESYEMPEGFEAAGEFAPPVEFPPHAEDEEDPLPISDSPYFDDPVFQDPEEKPQDPFYPPEDFD